MRLTVLVAGLACFSAMSVVSLGAAERMVRSLDDLSATAGVPAEERLVLRAKTALLVLEKAVIVTLGTISNMLSRLKTCSDVRLTREIAAEFRAGLLETAEKVNSALVTADLSIDSLTRHFEEWRRSLSLWSQETVGLLSGLVQDLVDEATILIPSAVRELTDVESLLDVVRTGLSMLIVKIEIQIVPELRSFCEIFGSSCSVSAV